MDKLDDLTLIEKRLENWFVKQSQSSVQFTGNVMKRWESLQERMNKTNERFRELRIVKRIGVITGMLQYAFIMQWDLNLHSASSIECCELALILQWNLIADEEGIVFVL